MCTYRVSLSGAAILKDVYIYGSSRLGTISRNLSYSSLAIPSSTVAGMGKVYNKTLVRPKGSMNSPII
ncbi:hypothetical protein [Pinibacter soli]|uniref:Uncharacterized protein n=1 Tax=Pinibacter soli TaxID=3044211 RepID=A0ABT6RJV3_9BACT|nr:hypothetical protein [Pinibacter soli]MDI3322741.1 hypothetical protein [Pinibacter soli]